MIEVVQIIISLFAGLGIGSLVTTFLKEHSDRKKLIYLRKLDAYTGYIKALAESIKSSSEEARQDVVYWDNRLSLIAPENICVTSKRFFNEPPSMFLDIRREIIQLMRSDLSASI